MSRLCPHCRQPMHVVQTTSHYGAHVFLNQCPNCGGTWFDGTELFEVKHGEAERIDRVDLEALSAVKSLNASVVLHCPVDDRELISFKDANFPDKIQVEACPACHGYWLNCGEFRQFQKVHRERMKSAAKPLEPKTKLLTDQIDKLLALYSEKDKYETLGKLGRFLSTPMDRYTLQPIPQLSRDRAMEDAAGTVGSLLNTILTASLRHLSKGLF